MIKANKNNHSLVLDEPLEKKSSHTLLVLHLLTSNSLIFGWHLLSAVLRHGHAGQMLWGPILISVSCVQYVFLCLNTDFVESTNTINICLILSTIYIFIPVSYFVGRGPSALLSLWAYNAVETALHLHIIFVWK